MAFIFLLNSYYYGRFLLLYVCLFLKKTRSCIEHVFALLYNAIFYNYKNVITFSGQCMLNAHCRVLYFHTQYRDLHRNTHNSNTSEHSRHLFIQLVYKSLYCLVIVICRLLFQTPTFPLPSLFCFFLLHPTPQKLQPSARE